MELSRLAGSLMLPARSPLLAHKLDEPPGPVIVLQIAQVRITGQQVLVNDDVMLAVHAVAAHYVVGIDHAGCEIFQAGIMKFVCADFHRSR